MPILLFANLKGGVAKTTNAVAVSECLADQGYRTLLIDADHQCMSSELLLGESRLLRAEARRVTLHDMLAAMIREDFATEQFDRFPIAGVSDIGGGIPKLSVIPCSYRIDEFAETMSRAKLTYPSNDAFQAMLRKHREKFRRWLVDRYDYTIVDCPPSIPNPVRLFLAIGDGYIVPSVPDRLSVRGATYFLERLQKAKFTKIRGIGTLWSLYRGANSVHRRTVNAAAEGVAPYDRLPPPFQTLIPNATKIAEATEGGRKPRSFREKYTPEFAGLYHRLAGEVVRLAPSQSLPAHDGAMAVAV